jgi:hypothetical protein
MIVKMGKKNTNASFDIAFANRLNLKEEKEVIM